MLAFAHHNPRWVAVPFEVVAGVIAAAVFVVSVAWAAIAAGRPVGRGELPCGTSGGLLRARAGPAWLRTAADADMDMPRGRNDDRAGASGAAHRPDQRLPQGGLPLQYLVPCRAGRARDARVIRLPAGVTAERIAKRRADLATGLYRHAKEVWPTTGR